jgi:hypothetical protein
MRGCGFISRRLTKDSVVKEEFRIGATLQQIVPDHSQPQTLGDGVERGRADPCRVEPAALLW